MKSLAGAIEGQDLTSSSPWLTSPAQSLQVAESILRSGDPRQPCRRLRGGLTVAVEERRVRSYRLLGESLWYPVANIMTTCDGCSFAVEYRHGGRFTAKSGRSRFALDTFLCWRCTRGGGEDLKSPEI